MLLKKLSPDSLFGRFLLLIITPIIIVQLVAIYAFYYRHLDNVNKYLARSLIGEIIFVKDIIDQNPLKDINLPQTSQVNFIFTKGEILDQKADISKANYQTSNVNIYPLFDSLHRFKLELKSQHKGYFAIFKDLDTRKGLIIKLQLKKGVLSVKIPQKRIITSKSHILIVWILFSALIAVVIAVLFLKNQIRSIKNLAKSADNFGKNTINTRFKPNGAKEIRMLGISFIKMKERIIKQIQQRSDMLLAVSHDLRTPLTRMKLQLSLMNEDDNSKSLKSDIEDMEKMINEYLDFGKGKKNLKKSKFNVEEFLTKIADSYPKLITKITTKNLLIDNKKQALKRALRNLLDNGFNYAKKVILTAKVVEDNLMILIDDDGVGIEKNKRDEVFKPFFRLDNARNLNQSSGSGLGLSIAYEAIKSCGGNIKLEDSDLGGLRVVINLKIK